MYKKVFVMIIVALFLFTNGIQVFASSEAEEFHNINDYLKISLRNANIPGASIVIVDKENVLYQNTYGNCKNIDDLFIIGSLSKSFTAMAIMQLVEGNKIELDSPISDYLPDAIDGDDITVRQLLNQTSGISTYAGQDNYEVTSSQGTHVYASANYGLLGQIIENATGCSYGEYINNNIFAPVGMSHSYTSMVETNDNRLIDGYRNYFGLTVKEQVSYPDANSTGWVSIPAGYLISNATDMGKYLQLYLNGGNDIISQDSINTMFYDNVEISENSYYGMGWALNANYSEPILAHSGLVENYMTYMYLLPKSEIGIIIMANTNDFLVANNMMDTISKCVALMLIGEEPVWLNSNLYWRNHLILDLIYLLTIVLCMLALLRIKKWTSRWKESKSLKWLIGFISIHFVIPTVILLIPVFLGVPINVIKGFVPDVFILSILDIVLLYVTGILKLIIKVENEYSHG